jgi:AraC-like DNA-binding protein
MPFVQIQVEWALHHSWHPTVDEPQRAMTADKVWLMLDGGAEVFAAGRKWHVQPGMAFLLTSAHNPKSLTTRHGAEWLSMGFKATLFHTIDLLAVLTQPVLWRPSAEDRDTLQGWMQQLVSEQVRVANFETVDATTWSQYWHWLKQEQERHAITSSFISEGLGRAVFGLCWRMLETENILLAAERAVPPWLNRVFQRIHDQPGTDVLDLAKEASFSPSQFRRLFHEWVGASPQTYLMQYRLNEAQRLLAKTDLPVGAIADHLGFKGLSQFTNRFKRSCGMTPKLYREREQQAARPS